MAIIIVLALIGSFAALLWSTRHRIYLHIAIASSVIPAAFFFGHQFGLSSGFLIAIGVMLAELILCLKSFRKTAVS